MMLIVTIFVVNCLNHDYTCAPFSTISVFKMNLCLHLHVVSYHELFLAQTGFHMFLCFNEINYHNL